MIVEVSRTFAYTLCSQCNLHPNGFSIAWSANKWLAMKRTALASLLLLGLLGCGQNNPRPVGVASTENTRWVTEVTTPQPSAADKGPDAAGTAAAPQTTTADAAAIRKSPLGIALAKEGYGVIPLVRDTKTSRLYLKCTVNGQAVCLIVDTGCTRTTISEESADELALVTRQSENTIVPGRSEALKVKRARLYDFRIANVAAAFTEVLVTDCSAIRADSRQRGYVVPD